MEQFSHARRPRGSRPNLFWGELAPSDHVCQVYEDETTFLDSLEEFIGTGLERDDTAVVIATSAHLNALEERLIRRGIGLNAAIATDRYMPLSAEETLERFVVNGWPDEIRFREVIGHVLSRARRTTTKVRAFGEMVALMWQRGFHGGTVRLEHLWTELCNEERFPLFCAYPKSAFTEHAASSMRKIAGAHTRMFSGDEGIGVPAGAR